MLFEEDTACAHGDVFPIFFELTVLVAKACGARQKARDFIAVASTYSAAVFVCVRRLSQRNQHGRVHTPTRLPHPWTEVWSDMHYSGHAEHYRQGLFDGDTQQVQQLVIPAVSLTPCMRAHANPGVLCALLCARAYHIHT